MLTKRRIIVTKSDSKKSKGYAGVKRLNEEHPERIPLVKECLESSQKYGEFAGRWVIESYKRKTKKIIKGPGLKPLVRYRILERTDSSRGGNRAYYVMPDPEGVKEALQELGELKAANGDDNSRLSERRNS